MSYDLLEQIRAENLSVYRASQQRLREDVGQESQIAQDYRGRLIYELLQNADDAMSSNSGLTAAISFFFDADSLWVANSGRPLDEADVRGLCGISASSKSQKIGKRRASIGHKGMGFKSVLEISDSPEVYSTTYCFSFSPEKALKAVDSLVQQQVLAQVSRAPVTRFPWSISDDHPVWKRFRERGMNTVFRFPFRQKISQEQRDALAETLKDLPVTSLVFLKHLGNVEVTLDRNGESFHSAWKVSRQRQLGDDLSEVPAFTEAGTYMVTLTQTLGFEESFLVAHDPEVSIDSHRGGLDEFSWDGIELTEVSIAARLRDNEPIGLEKAWKKFHVFLPTGEPCPYEILVSGAFGSNLSRQEIRVEDDPSNYNRYLVRNSARILREVLIPVLQRNGASPIGILKLFDRGNDCGKQCSTPTAQALFDETKEIIADLKFVPCELSESTTISRCILPPLVQDPSVGEAFRALLPPRASFGEKSFPTANCCGSQIARILVDHGASELSPEEAVSVLSEPDPARSIFDVSGNLFLDPVLNVLERLWTALDVDKRERLSWSARRNTLFPVGITTSDTAQRISTEGVTCFYPPRTLHGTIPLDGLCFLMQEICWGDLAPKERNQVLRQQMVTWQAIFDVKEFKFPDVMRASVLPLLDLEADADSCTKRMPLHSLEKIAAICQLAGRAPNPTSPLPYERLGSNRAIFNLSRLDVPCRGPESGQVRWVPAYRAYFGCDWIDDGSVERILETAKSHDTKNLPEIEFLAAPETFIGLLKKYEHLKIVSPPEESLTGADEVGLDEDEDASLEVDERSRWLAFFQWLGVNQSLRPVHFHDVEDRASGWLTTQNLQRPKGWIFSNVNAEAWNEFVRNVRLSIMQSEKLQDATPYFYQLHDLEYLVDFLNVSSSDESAAIGRALYEHLARNWGILERFSQAVVALVPLTNAPSMRTKPPRAKDDELYEAGPDFWVSRLRKAAFCPTGHGPRRANQVWLPTLEVERRFGRRAKTGSYLIPVLDTDHVILKGKAKGLAQTLGIREDLTPANFSFEDAEILLRRLHILYSAKFEARNDLRGELREVIRPAYRNLFELLSGRSQGGVEETNARVSLETVPLLATDGEGNYNFFEKRDFFYLDRRDTRERLQCATNLWSFVIEALPAARAPISQIFGVRILEESLQWSPSPGDRVLDDTEVEILRKHLRDLAPYLLARIAVDRADEKQAKTDAQQLKQFVDVLEPVTYLEIGAELDGVKLDLGTVVRDAFVAMKSGTPIQAFVVWEELAWPPMPREAEALANALCEVLGPGYFESFLALIQASTLEDRERLLRRAGASTDIDERLAIFLGDNTAPSTAQTESNENVEPRTIVDGGITEQPAEFPLDSLNSRVLDAKRVPLFVPEELSIDGQPIILTGPPLPPRSAESNKGSYGSSGTVGRRGHHGYGGQTDLEALNRVGMWITLNFERNRMRNSGYAHAQIFDPGKGNSEPDDCIFDVSSPDKIAQAQNASISFNNAMLYLNRNFGISVEWPGFDVLTLDPKAGGGVGRLIELKSSGVSSRVQEMSWNEWKSASSNVLGQCYYLYLVGNLRSDIEGSVPFVRTIRNPFAQLRAEIQTDRTVTRKVQLAVHYFDEAEHLNLTVSRNIEPSSGSNLIVQNNKTSDQYSCVPESFAIKE